MLIWNCIKNYDFIFYMSALTAVDSVSIRLFPPALCAPMSEFWNRGGFANKEDVCVCQRTCLSVSLATKTPVGHLGRMIRTLRQRTSVRLAYHEDVGRWSGLAPVCQYHRYLFYFPLFRWNSTEISLPEPTPRKKRVKPFQSLFTTDSVYLWAPSSKLSLLHNSWIIFYWIYVT